MTAKLIWITPEPLKVIEYCARVSNPENQAKMDFGEIQPGRLTRYLIEHKHWSPFEMASACLEIETTRDIGRQILRHRSFSFQEFSQRYSEVTGRTVWRESRRRAKVDRQGSEGQHSGHTAQTMEFAADDAFRIYGALIKDGVAPECARAILPEGYTPTRMYMSGTIRSWIHYLQVRLDEHTQKEHRELAEQILDCLSNKVPEIGGWVR